MFEDQQTLSNIVAMLLLVLEAKTGVFGTFGVRSCCWLLGPKVAIVLCTLTVAPTSDMWLQMLFFPVWYMFTLATMVYWVDLCRLCNGVACVIGGLFGQVCLLMTPWGLYGAMVPQVPLIVDVLGPTDTY